MNQPTLFACDEPQLARARVSDPVTSHEAAANVEASGSADSDRAAILAVIRTVNRGADGYPRHGWTGGEIAEALGDGWSNVRVMRRTSELERSREIYRGPSRKCAAKGTEMLTFHPVE